jgi:uncharacterized protein (DUF1697 family)
MRHYVIFTSHRLTPKQLASQVTWKPEVETVTAGSQALYWAAPVETLTRTAIGKLTAHPAYQELTIRNLRTTLALRDLLRERR